MGSLLSRGFCWRRKAGSRRVPWQGSGEGTTPLGPLPHLQGLASVAMRQCGVSGVSESMKVDAWSNLHSGALSPPPPSSL